MPSSSRFPLRQWIWRAFVQSALIPLILVESVLIAVYLLSNQAIRDTQIGHLQEAAVKDLASAALREGQIIDGRLRSIESLVQVYRDATLQALLDDRFQADELEHQRHASTDSGVFYTRSDDGRAASFYANSTPREQQDHAKVMRLSQVDPLMRSIKQANPLVAALYFNSWDSYNRIYPWFDTPAQYPHDMVIPDYNFYYLADAKHNPERKVMWTEVYLDPAGLGWMMSAIAPVYRGDFLEGVVGLDITVDQVLGEIAELNVPWQGYAMLVSHDHNIMALPAAGELDFGLRELTHYSYEEAVRREVLKPEDFNLTKREGMAPLLRAMNEGRGNVQEVLLGGRKQLVAWSEIPQTGWRLLLVVDEEQIFHETNQLAERYMQIGYLLIAGLLAFYLLFFALMWLRSRHLSNQLARPIAGIVEMAGSLGQGNYLPASPDSRIAEVSRLAEAVQQAGKQLQASELERQEAQNSLQLVLESTTESLWHINTQDLTIELSERFVRRFGLGGRHLSLSEFNQRVHPDDLERLRHLRKHFAESGDEHFDAEYRYLDAKGDYLWLLSRGKVLTRDDNGWPLRIAGTHVDITRLKQVQEELRHASLEALAASQAKSRFLSSMSHELRTPLNAIHGFAQLIEMETQDKADAGPESDYAREIVNASRHLTSLVDDILDLSSIESRRQQLQLQPIEIGGLLNGCAELVLPEVQQRQLQLQVMEPAQPPLFVQGDPRRVRQILLNLLSNAIKYNSPRGMIRMGYEVRADCVRLWVDDTGPGLSTEQQAQLFQPFQRLGRESSNIPGTGIGLVLCRELASLMEGEIGLRSEPGVGSRFWLDLPSAASPEGEASDAADEPAQPRQRLVQVLCVEDHPACMKILQASLREFAEVRGVSSCQRALAELQSSEPALVLLDIDLPDGSGLEVLDSMRADPRLREIPVMVISAVADARLFEDARARGASACLSKPVDLQEVRQVALGLLYSGY
ncbi:hybrid sensor histidine kinase/response regulator [Ectopseudomonas hydrolytica]|uniref:hybrid sensor histidine kinase/response regulator n=1 Tax=Ectopseudomonas hydrolytica TaxID=2493633 RepID=UPI0018A75893|nr:MULTISPECIES: ATP-binding protein [Pseudomonas]MBA4244269.1 histidine kinase [Pseudomonas sp.]MBF8163462.1 response regulator [Pseudomonas mendocina]UTH32853.1 ATP-binding protein [Pseudomonas hydrolytica]UZZ12026.1 ATP-binding protein [Pseudomonas mendocina]